MRNLYFISLITGSLVLAAVACSSDDPDTTPGGTGGGTASGGSGPAPSTGGAASGGSPGTGGSDQNMGGGGMGGSLGGDSFFTAEDAGLTIGTGAYDYNDDGGSSVNITAANGELCTQGTAAQVVDDMWDVIWGAGLGVQLGEDGAATDLTGSTGFSFTITGVPSAIRVGALLYGSENTFFTTSIVEGENTLLFADLAQGDWVEEPETWDITMVKDFQWQVPSNDRAEVEFDFCISDIQLVSE